MFVCLQIQFSVRARLSEYTRVRALTISFQGSTTRNSTASGPPYVSPSPFASFNTLAAHLASHRSGKPRTPPTRAPSPASRCTRTTRPTRGTMRLRARSTCSRSTGCRSACRCTRCVRARDVFFFFLVLSSFFAIVLVLVFGVCLWVGLWGVVARPMCRGGGVRQGGAGRGGVVDWIGGGATTSDLARHDLLSTSPPTPHQIPLDLTSPFSLAFRLFDLVFFPFHADR